MSVRSGKLPFLGSEDEFLTIGATALNYFAYNFIKVHRTLRMTPAMAAGVTDRPWDGGGLGCSLGSIRAEGGKSGVRVASGALEEEQTRQENHAANCTYSTRRHVCCALLSCMWALDHHTHRRPRRIGTPFLDGMLGV